MGLFLRKKYTNNENQSLRRIVTFSFIFLSCLAQVKVFRFVSSFSTESIFVNQRKRADNMISSDNIMSLSSSSSNILDSFGKTKAFRSRKYPGKCFVTPMTTNLMMMNSFDSPTPIKSHDRIFSNKNFWNPKKIFSLSLNSLPSDDDESTTLKGENLDDYDKDGPIYEGLNPSQIEAVTQPIYSISRVIAGPGAGKTRVLTCRIAHLLKEDERYRSRILAVTFTKKAASEMQHRLDSLLKQDYEHYHSSTNDNEDIQTGGSTENSDGEIHQEEIGSEGTTRMRPNLMDRVTLGTFHSVCSRILRWFGKELHALPSIQHYTQAAEKRKKQQQQQKNDNSTSTSLTLDGTFTIIDQSDQLRLIKECLDECKISLKSGNNNGNDIRPITIVNAVGQIKSIHILSQTGQLTSSKNSNNNSQEYEKMTSKVRKIAEEVYPLYRKKLLFQNALDFDDLILLSRELLMVNPTVRQNLNKRWSHILVDEFQDTSQAQLDLVKLLTTESLLVVGDGDQSIYSWRGAYAESMSDFANEFNNHEYPEIDKDGGNSKQISTSNKVQTIYLMENYR